MHILLIQTIGPLVVLGALELLTKVLSKKAAKEAAKAAKTSNDASPPTSAFLAEICSNVSFFLLFLLYPGSSTKVFHALMCNTFDGEGENGDSFLRVVSRQHLPSLSPCLDAVYRRYILSRIYLWLSCPTRRTSRLIATRRFTKDLSFHMPSV